MTHGSLFSGIGGFDLAAEWMGWENVFHCEWNSFGHKILKHYWPNAISYEDITKSDFTIHRGRIDVLSGGFPCQPYSLAGKRLGKDDERHLWPEMYRAIKEIEPTWVVGENVRGIVNWNGGLVFDEVCIELENAGFEVQPILLPAASVNAPHKRERVWFIAYSRDNANSRNTGKISIEATEKNKGRQEQSTTSQQQIQLLSESNSIFGDDSNTKCQGFQINDNTGTIYREKRGMEEERDSPSIKSSTIFEESNITNTNSKVLECRDGKGTTGQRAKQKKRIESFDGSGSWKAFPSQSPLCGGDDGIPTRLDNITVSKWRNESIKAYGNAVVPQVVYQVFKTIEKYESESQNISNAGTI